MPWSAPGNPEVNAAPALPAASERVTWTEYAADDDAAEIAMAQAETKRGLIEDRGELIAGQIELDAAECSTEIKGLRIVPAPAAFGADACIEHVDDRHAWNHQGR